MGTGERGAAARCRADEHFQRRRRGFERIRITPSSLLSISLSVLIIGQQKWSVHHLQWDREERPLINGPSEAFF